MGIRIFSILVMVVILGVPAPGVPIARPASNETGGAVRTNDEEETPRSGELGASTSTAFGIYKPYLVPTYKSEAGLSEPAIAANFSNVATADARFPWATYFSAAERKLLAANGFVARPEALANFGSAYGAETSPAEMGSFITVDAILHGLRVTIAEATRDMERNYAAPGLTEDLASISLAITTQLERKHSTTLDAPMLRVLAYVQTAQLLLNPRAKADPRVASTVEAELKKIKDAVGSLPSSVFPQRTIDYAAFAPAGYYAADQQLGAYYRAKTWLSRVGFNLRQSGGGFDVAAVRDAALLARMIDGTEQAEDIRHRLRDINEAGAFLGGTDTHVNEWDVLAGAMNSYYGRIVVVGPDYLADDKMLNGFARYLGDQLQDAQGGYTSVTFRLMDATDAPMGLMDRTAREMHAAQGTYGYALLSAAGSQRATGLLGARSGFSGDAHTTLGGSTAAWVGDLQHTLLFTLQPMLKRTGSEGDPHFMQSEAWRDRELASALGAVADYAHDPATLPMQSVVKAGRVAPSRELHTEGYVESNPEAWARVASLAAYLRNGLIDSRDDHLVGRRVEAKLRDIESVAANMMQIASLERGAKDLSKEQLALIASLRDRIVAYETFADKSLQGDGYVVTEGSVAVSGDARIANGHPLAIYVIVPRNDGDGGLMLTRGAVYSYYETDAADDEWLRQVTTPSGRVELDQRLTASFVGTDRPFTFDRSKFLGLSASVPASAAPYTPTKSERIASTYRAEVHLDASIVSRRDGELWFTVTAPSLEGSPLVAVIADRSGAVVQHVEIGHIENGERLDVVGINKLEAGEYNLKVEDPAGHLLAVAPFRVLR